MPFVATFISSCLKLYPGDPRLSGSLSLFALNASLAAVASRPAVALREGWSAKEATDQRFNAAKPNFPRKGSKNFTQYLSERPEMTTQ